MPLAEGQYKPALPTRSRAQGEIMNRIMASATLLLAVATPALAASTPQYLLQALLEAARQGDVERFLSHTSNASQRALADADAARYKLDEA